MLRQFNIEVPFDGRNGVAFLKRLASVAKSQSFGRAGLMCLTKCISSAACGIGQCSDISPVILQDKESYPSDKVDLLDTLRYIIESCKQHFNPSYRHQGTYRFLVVLNISTSVFEFTNYGNPSCFFQFVRTF